MISWFARNSVAANLLMVACVLAGIATLISGKIPLEVFPEFESDEISISIPYRGATPEEVEESVVIRVEEAIADVEGIDKLFASASENSASITVEVDESFVPREVLDDIKARVDGISTLPDDAERPVVSLGQAYRSVINVILSGELSERDLRKLGERIRDEIGNLPGISNAELQGVRPFEINLEIDESTLQRYGLTLDEVASAVRSGSVDFPAGVLETPAGDVVLRTRGRSYTGADYEKIVVSTREDGSRLLLGDIAAVRDGFDQSPFIARYDGERCVLIAVTREADQNVIKLAETVKEFMQDARERLPAGVSIHYFGDRSKIVRGRLDTLIDNAGMSFVLVLLVLSLFLRPTLAFWVVLGIPITFLAAFAVLPFIGVTINIVSLFGFILVLGVVVDDAIVTGENIYSRQRLGENHLEAAIKGTKEVAVPVVFGVLTTMLAFVPLLLNDEGRGRWQAQIAVIVIVVLAFSLVESKLILPAHLAHGSPRNRDRPGPLTRFQLLFSDGLENFVRRFYTPALRTALAHRYTTFAVFLGLLVLLWGYIAGGHIPFTMFPRVPSERATARLTMHEGTPFRVTQETVHRISAAARQLQEKYRDENGVSIVKHIIDSSGGQGLTSSRRRNSTGQDHLGEVTLEFTGPEEREEEVNTLEVVREWRTLIGPVTGAKEINYRAEIGFGGDPVDIQLLSTDIDALAEAASRVKEELATIPDVFDISDTLDEGRDEIRLKLRPRAELLGLNVAALGRQVRQAFYGEEVQRLQRGRDDIRVMLRYPEADRRSLASLESMRIRTPGGIEVPFDEVAEIEFGRSFARISRIDRNRALNVKADYNKERVDATALFARLEVFLDAMVLDYPGMRYSFGGEAEEAEEAAAAQSAGMVLIAFGLFAMLAVPFRSYAQPLIVMSVIPFGAIGAVAGHMVLGLNLTQLSIFGMLALAGVVVNDSLVLVDFINRRRREGTPLREAVALAGQARFRPIVLTSFTTFAGLAPLILEKSTQAQFLIPMAVSLGFGILFATAVTLLLVPVNYLVLEDVRGLFNRWFGTDKPKADPELNPPTSGVGITT